MSAARSVRAKRVNGIVVSYLGGDDVIEIRHKDTGRVLLWVDEEELADVDMEGADLSGANLAGANLERADLADAFLTGADLTGARLVRADLTDTNLNGALL